MNPKQITLHALEGIPNIQAGADLVQVIQAALEHNGLKLEPGDVVVVTQKIVSKAENQDVYLPEVDPSDEAQQLAEATGKDPRLVEVILQNSRAVIRQQHNVLIMETNHGWICANAGVDRSNVSGPQGDIALPLPDNPDASAREIRDGLMSESGIDIAVIISDTHGRPWRLGALNLALGVAGMLPISDLRGQPDMFGYTLRATSIARADELAAAAGLIAGQAAEGIPVVLIRGADYVKGTGQAVQMQRAKERDLFR